MLQGHQECASKRHTSVTEVSNGSPVQAKTTVETATELRLLVSNGYDGAPKVMMVRRPEGHNYHNNLQSQRAANGGLTSREVWRWLGECARPRGRIEGQSEKVLLTIHNQKRQGWKSRRLRAANSTKCHAALLSSQS